MRPCGHCVFAFSVGHYRFDKGKKTPRGFLGVVFFIFAFIILLASFLLSLMILIKRITPFGLDAVVFNNDVIITLDGETGLPIPFIGGFMSLVFDYIVLESLVYRRFRSFRCLRLFFNPLNGKSATNCLHPSNPRTETATLP